MHYADAKAILFCDLKRDGVFKNLQPKSETIRQLDRSLFVKTSAILRDLLNFIVPLGPAGDC